MSTPVYDRHGVTVLHGDALAELAAMPDSSVDAVITDPPYGLRFMGQGWDGDDIVAGITRRRGQAEMPDDGKSGQTGGYRSAAAEAGRYEQTVSANQAFGQWCQLWAAECLRVLKPGGHLAAFGGTRTFHRLVCGVEDAGFEIRDDVGVAGWVYASGFPKSLDVSKAIDKTRDDRDDVVRVTTWLADQAAAVGVTRAAVDAHFGTNDMGGWWLTDLRHRCALPTPQQWKQLRALIGFGDTMDAEVARLNGRKGAPGEMWAERGVVGHGHRVRRPGGDVPVAGASTGTYDLTVAAQDASRAWQGWGTALKPAWEPIVLARKPLAGTVAGNVLAHGTGALHIDACRTGAGNDTGRWPTNVLLVHHPECGPDEAPAPCAPGCPVAELDQQSGTLTSGKMRPTRPAPSQRSTYGQDAASGYTTMETYGDSGGASRFFPTFRWEAKAPTFERPQVDGVSHPTVKPVGLMRWLVRLLVPPGGVVLDPFAGSGTTGQAARAESVRALLVEREADYVPLIVARLDARDRTPAASSSTSSSDKPLDLFDLLDGGGAA